MNDHNTLLFFGEANASGFLSNFYGTTSSKTFRLVLDDQEWPSVEHYFQAQKFLPYYVNYAEKIRTAESPFIAKAFGSQQVRYTYPFQDHHREIARQSKVDGVTIRADWEEKKEEVMLRAVRAKFQQNPILGSKLLATNSAILKENSPYDAYWGVGRQGNGQNRLGVLLMTVRSEMQK